jgi:hypothetical protein
MPRPSHSSRFLALEQCWVSTDHEAPHYVGVPSPLLPCPSCAPNILIEHKIRYSSFL